MRRWGCHTLGSPQDRRREEGLQTQQGGHGPHRGAGWLFLLLGGVLGLQRKESLKQREGGDRGDSGRWASKPALQGLVLSCPRPLSPRDTRLLPTPVL